MKGLILGGIKKMKKIENRIDIVRKKKVSVAETIDLNHKKSLPAR